MRLDVAGQAWWIVLDRGGRRRVRVLGSDGERHRLEVADLVQARCAALEGPVAAETERVLADAGLADSPRARTALLRARLGTKRVDGL